MISDKKGAHGGEVDEEGKNNAVNFRNIPDTCGQCHDEFLDAYLGSKHFKHPIKAEREKQGPSCGTCRGSMNTTVLDVTTVNDACARCHNDETENQPEIPEGARTTLNKFLSIDRLQRYLSARLKPTRDGNASPGGSDEAEAERCAQSERRGGCSVAIMDFARCGSPSAVYSGLRRITPRPRLPRR